MKVKKGRLIIIAAFFLFGLFSTGKTAWATVPAMTSPAPGSTLASSDVTFNWSAADPVDAYWLGVGTSQDSIKNDPWVIFSDSQQQLKHQWRSQGYHLVVPFRYGCGGELEPLGNTSTTLIRQLV